MKKMIALLLIGVLCMGFTACGSDKSTQDQAEFQSDEKHQEAAKSSEKVQDKTVIEYWHCNAETQGVSRLKNLLITLMRKTTI